MGTTEEAEKKKFDENFTVRTSAREESRRRADRRLGNQLRFGGRTETANKKKKKRTESTVI